MQLIVENLVVARGGRTIIDGLSFDVDGGGALLLTGRNGAGKTTLIRALAGFLAPLSGGIRLAGFDAERELREACHYIGHQDANKGALTVLENLRFWYSYLDMVPPSPDFGGAEPVRSDPAAADERIIWPALERLGLDSLSDIPAAYLSAGQKRRLALARLLVARRPLWLLDEPSVSLDAASTALLTEVISDHVRDGGIVVAATHLPLGLDAASELRLGVRELAG